MMKIISIALVILAVVGGGYLFYKSSLVKKSLPSYNSVYSPSSMNVNSANPETNSSDTQLDRDMSSINSQMNTVTQEQSNIDAGLNQQAPNLQ